MRRCRDGDVKRTKVGVESAWLVAGLRAGLARARGLIERGGAWWDVLPSSALSAFRLAVALLNSGFSTS